MDKYTKAFIVASLMYLLLGSILGMLTGINASFANYQFTHVHLNLLGFMAMMIYGVGYFILPRFNARALRWPGMVPVHFYTANVGLLGMCIFQQMRYASGSSLMTTAFVFFALVEVVSVLLFVGNMIATFALAPRIEAKSAHSAAPRRGVVSSESLAHGGGGASGQSSIKISPDMRVGEILECYPEARLLIAEAGIRALADETHAEQVKKMPVTLRAACVKHGIDLSGLVTKLEQFIRSGGTHVQATPGFSRPASGAETLSLNITPDTLIGDAIAAFPRTREVFMRYFGEGCFDCPGQAVESIEQGALMHNVDTRDLIRSLNEAIGE
jgi:hybrid cluster-associated redox disulfide protein